jgi:hypothetical protein
MDLKVIHDTIRYYVNKDQQAYISPQEIDNVLDKAQLVLFNQYHTNPKLPAKVQAAVYGDSQRIDDALSIFKDKYTFTTGDTPSGIVTLPANYLHLLSLYTTQYSNQLGRNVYSAVQVLNEEELIERLNSQVIPVSAEDPIAIMNKQNKIQLFPEVATNGGVYYLRRPVAPVFVYTQSGRTITYNQAGSTQLEWRDMDVNNVIAIALSYYGLNMSSGEVMQFAQAKQVEGQ